MKLTLFRSQGDEMWMQQEKGSLPNCGLYDSTTGGDVNMCLMGGVPPRYVPDLLRDTEEEVVWHTDCLPIHTSGMLILPWG